MLLVQGGTEPLLLRRSARQQREAALDASTVRCFALDKTRKRSVS
jgi:hypothetical protein